jgi:hypothetical protein
MLSGQAVGSGIEYGGVWNKVFVVFLIHLHLLSTGVHNFDKNSTHGDK